MPILNKMFWQKKCGAFRRSSRKIKVRFGPPELRRIYGRSSSDIELRMDKKHTPQQFLAETYSWNDMLDALADIYSGVSIEITAPFLCSYLVSDMQ